MFSFKSASGAEHFPLASPRNPRWPPRWSLKWLRYTNVGDPLGCHLGFWGQPNGIDVLSRFILQLSILKFPKSVGFSRTWKQNWSKTPIYVTLFHAFWPPFLMISCKDYMKKCLNNKVGLFVYKNVYFNTKITILLPINRAH